jgi:hypothetical protein
MLIKQFSCVDEESSLENMVQILWTNIKMYGKPRSFMTPLPILFASIASTITASNEEAHPEEMFQLVTKNLDNPFINTLPK